MEPATRGVHEAGASRIVVQDPQQQRHDLLVESEVTAQRRQDLPVDPEVPPQQYSHMGVREEIDATISSLIEKNFTLSLECDGLKTDLVKIRSIAKSHAIEVIALRAERCKLEEHIFRLSKLSEEHYRIQNENHTLIEGLWKQRLFLQNKCAILSKFIVQAIGNCLDEAQFAIGASIDDELQSDVSSVVDQLELLLKQAEDNLHPMQPI